MTEHTPEQITLPDKLTGSADLSRVARELKALDESLHQTKLRKPGQPTKLARSSVTLEELASVNKVSLTNAKQRAQLVDLLDAMQEHAPRIRMVLASEPSSSFTQKITGWLRANVHPLALLDIGLQPNLSAGCMLRTQNKIFDMSLKHRFTENRGLLVQKIGEVA